MAGSIPGLGQAVNSLNNGSTLGGVNKTGDVQAVMGADNKLQAYDPSTMAGTTVAPKPVGPGYTSAGMTSTGVPEYLANWLASGAQGTAPVVGGPATVTVDPAQEIIGNNLDPNAHTMLGKDPWGYKMMRDQERWRKQQQQQVGQPQVGWNGQQIWAQYPGTTPLHKPGTPVR